MHTTHYTYTLFDYQSEISLIFDYFFWIKIYGFTIDILTPTQLKCKYNIFLH